MIQYEKMMIKKKDHLILMDVSYHSHGRHSLYRRITLPTIILPIVYFTDSSFYRQFILPTVHFADNHFTDSYFTDNYFTDNHFTDNHFTDSSFYRQFVLPT